MSLALLIPLAKKANKTKIEWIKSCLHSGHACDPTIRTKRVLRSVLTIDDTPPLSNTIYKFNSRGIVLVLVDFIFRVIKRVCEENSWCQYRHLLMVNFALENTHIQWTFRAVDELERLTTRRRLSFLFYEGDSTLLSAKMDNLLADENASLRWGTINMYIAYPHTYYILNWNIQCRAFKQSCYNILNYNHLCLIIGPALTKFFINQKYF